MQIWDILTLETSKTIGSLPDRWLGSSTNDPGFFILVGHTLWLRSKLDRVLGKSRGSVHAMLLYKNHALASAKVWRNGWLLLIDVSCTPSIHLKSKSLYHAMLCNSIVWLHGALRDSVHTTYCEDCCASSHQEQAYRSSWRQISSSAKSDKDNVLEDNGDTCRKISETLGSNVSNALCLPQER